ncbi:hypothetical protein TSUD_323990 [Trifolium subterraneum]|uniref:Uncharacterized protein n=1 Tax=Trifolium subterraneum TaxID=3900 RepID=A0A2Z6NF26_TRISU|nr:hypothetical protein TSUD_323990 [Trifolium subterraneum]
MHVTVLFERGLSSFREWAPRGNESILNYYCTKRVLMKIVARVRKVIETNSNLEDKFLIVCKGDVVKEATWKTKINVRSQFHKFRLEDKFVVQEGVLLGPKSCLLGLEEQLIQQVTNGPKEGYSHKRRVLKGKGIDRTQLNLPQSHEELVNYKLSGPKE